MTLCRAVALAATALLALAATARAEAQAPSPFADWAAVFVAGDFHAHSGKPTEVFDNARRDVAAAFQAAGFEAGNIRQFSVRPQRYPKSQAKASRPLVIAEGLEQAAAKAQGGCLVYVTSHGAPEGVLIGDDLLPPRMMAAILDRACARRPTVVVLSACFSGVFIPALRAPHRLVLTAARPDRTSFGCTETDTYPYYDACILESLPKAGDFLDLGKRARLCVDRREKAEAMTPPSEPQMHIGAALMPLLPLYAFKKP